MGADTGGQRGRQEEKREQAPALHMLLSTIISIAGSRRKSRKICGKRCERSRSMDGRDREKSAGRRLPATTTEKSRAETRPLQALAAAGRRRGDICGGCPVALWGGGLFW